MGNAIFRVLPVPKPLGRCSKFCMADYVGTPPHTQVLGLVSSNGACLHMREIVTLRCLFFLFFLGFVRLATGQPVGPIVAVNGYNEYTLVELSYTFITKITEIKTTKKSESIKRILDSLYLKQETKSFVINIHTSRIDHNADWPRNLSTFIAQTMTHKTKCLIISWTVV